MDNAKIDTNYLSFVKAKKSNINIMLDIIRRCVLEINAADYTQNQVKDLLNSFTEDWLKNIIVPKWKPSIHMPKEAARIFFASY